METVSKVICILTIVTVGRDQLLWAKISITLEMVSMAMVPMHQNTDYINGFNGSCYGNGSLTTIP